MGVLDRVNFIIATYGRLIVGLFNFRLWPPFLLFFLVMLLQIVMLNNMFSPLLAGWLIPIVQWIGDESVTHYPHHIAYIPSVFEKMNLLFSWLIDSLMSATAISMFASYFSRERVQFVRSLKTAAGYYPRLLVIWLIVFVPILLLFWTLPGLFEGFVEGAPRRKLALMIGMQGLQTLLTALFVYVVPYMILLKTPFMKSFTRSFSLFFRSFFTTIIFVALPQFLLLPLVYALQNTGNIVNKFNPELIVWMTVGLAVALTLANYFTLGAIVRFFREIAED